MLPSSSSSSIRAKDRPPLHPGVRRPAVFSHSNAVQPRLEEFRAASKETRTLELTVEMLRGLVRDESNTFEEIAAIVERSYGVSIARGRRRRGGLADADTETKSHEVSFASHVPSPPKSPRESLPTNASLTSYPSFLFASSIAQARISTTPSDDPTLKLEDPQPQNTFQDLSYQDISVSTAASEESINEELYTWLDLQGQSTLSPDLPTLSPLSTGLRSPLSFVGQTLQSQWPRTAKSTPKNGTHPLSPPPTIRINHVATLSSSSHDLAAPEEAQDGLSFSGLGLFFGGPDATAANSQQPSQNGMGDESDEKRDVHEELESPSGSEDSDADGEGYAEKPPPRVHLQFQKVIAEMRSMSVRRSLHRACSPPPTEEAATEDALSDSVGTHPDESVGVIDDDYEGGERATKEEWKEVTTKLLELSLKQETQAQSLRLLAEELLDIALLRRTLGGMLFSKYHDGSGDGDK